MVCGTGSLAPGADAGLDRSVKPLRGTEDVVETVSSKPGNDVAIRPARLPPGPLPHGSRREELRVYAAELYLPSMKALLVLRCSGKAEPPLEFLNEEWTVRKEIHQSVSDASV